jgi:ABC-type uncharacterized transport system auxiliary subunit
VSLTLQAHKQNSPQSAHLIHQASSDWVDHIIFNLLSSAFRRAPSLTSFQDGAILVLSPPFFLRVDVSVLTTSAFPFPAPSPLGGHCHPLIDSTVKTLTSRDSSVLAMQDFRARNNVEGRSIPAFESASFQECLRIPMMALIALFYH